jgi:cell division protein ZipA
MSQLRGSLLILGVLFIAALIWWEWRRPRQASGGLERMTPREPTAASPDALPRVAREPLLALPEMRAREPLAPRELPRVDMTHDPPVLTPAAAAAAADEGEREERQREPGAREHETFNPASEPATAAPPTIAAAAAPEDQAPARGMAREVLPELPQAPPLTVQWPADQERRVLALRLVAPLPDRFAGRSLRQALAAEGFELGQFAIFHKPDEERRAVLSAASLTRPGTFDVDTMDFQHYGGLSLFAVLPGPKSPPQAFDELVFTARNLNERLHGVLQDEQGSPLTPARIALLREQLRGGAAS